jgi:hypothetical protein
MDISDGDITSVDMPLILPLVNNHRWRASPFNHVHTEYTYLMVLYWYNNWIIVDKIPQNIIQ